MRNLTFKGFLQQYLKELSLCGSCGINRLSKELENNARLLEPLALFSVITENDKYVNKIDNNMLKEEVEKLATFSNIEDSLKNGLLGPRYTKVYVSYQCRINRFHSEDDTKELILNKINELKDKKGVSNYRIYKDLNINAGNANDFLKNGNLRKLSLDKAKEVLNYLKEY